MKIIIKIIFYVLDLGINFGFCVSQKISLFLQLNVYSKFKLGYIYDGITRNRFVEISTKYRILSHKITIVSVTSCLLCFVDYYNHRIGFMYSERELFKTKTDFFHIFFHFYPAFVHFSQKSSVWRPLLTYIFDMAHMV